MFADQNIKFFGTVGFLLAILLLPVSSAAQETQYEEIVVNFDIPKLVNSDIFVQYDGQTLYIPLQEIFRLLEVVSDHDRETMRITGYMINKDDPFVMDFARGLVIRSGKEMPLARDGYIYDGQYCWLRMDLMETYFDLPMQFDFSKLQVRLPLNKEFPAFQKLKRKQAQEKLRTKKKVAREVYALPFNREYAKGGVADWMIATNPMGGRNVHYYGLNFGGMLMGGDITVSGNGDTKTGVELDQMRYKWHYYVNKNRYLTQVELGDVNVGGHFSRRLDGLKLTNRPQVRRKYFQTIDLSGNLGEGWEVELYVDNRLIDFTQTDNSGEYNFNLDIFYGASSIILKMYGPNGEIKIEEKDVKVPYNLIPKGEFEYLTTVGFAENQLESGFYTQTGCYYGITGKLTTGVSVDIPLAVELKDSVDISAKSRPMVGMEMAFQPMTNLTFNGFAAPDYALRGGFSFTRPSVFSFNSNVTFYQPNKIRNPLEQVHKLSFSISSPLRVWGRSMALRCNLTHDRYPRLTLLGLNYGFSSSISYFYVNYIGRYKMSHNIEFNQRQKTATSQIIIGSRRTKIVRPQFRIDYDHSRNEITKYGVYLSRRLFRTGQLSLSFERNHSAKSNLYMLTFNIFTSFADFSTRVIASTDQVAMTQSQHGSVRFDQGMGMVHLNRRNGVGQCSAILHPFVDDNFNGVHDEGEEEIFGMRAKIKGASGRPTGKNRNYYYDRLQPYDEYIVEIDQYSLDDPLLKPVHDGFRVHFNPNIVTSIEVPVVVVSEVSGTVKRQLENGQSGMGAVRIELINLTTGSRTKVTTFNNGEFYYLGLIPGRYRARILPEQLHSYGYVSDPPAIDFEVKAVEGGMVIEDVDFLMLPDN
ncbi:MAG: hypothetical protein GY841_14405 [FCB group bacterium]|nr:hypothetical protein [FCB group bacterium]